MLLAYGFLRKVFEVFEAWKTPIDMIATSEVAVSLTIDCTDHLNDIICDLEQYGTIEIDRDMAIICIVGDFARREIGFGGYGDERPGRGSFTHDFLWRQRTQHLGAREK